MNRVSRAAILVAERRIEVRDVPLPDAAAPGGILLKVEGCGMCGSDIGQYEGETVQAGLHGYPVIPGHETIGRIAELSEETSRLRGLKVGDRVAVHGTAPCGVCKACVAGGRCSQAFYHGFRSLDEGSGLWGGYSEWMELSPRTTLYPVDGDLPIEDALLFNPLAAGYDWVIRLGEFQVGQSVLILGSGQRGLACVVAAVEAGASQIIVTGLARDDFKLDVARKLGTHVTLIAEDNDVARAVMDATGGRGVDLAIDTTPTSFQPIKDAIAAVRAGGTIVLGGIKGYKPMPEFPVDIFLHKQIRMIGALSSTAWATQQAIRAVESRRLPLHLLHSHRFDLDGVEHAIHLLAGDIAGQAALHISIIPGLNRAEQGAGL